MGVRQGGQVRGEAPNGQGKGPAASRWLAGLGFAWPAKRGLDVDSEPGKQMLRVTAGHLPCPQPCSGPAQPPLFSWSVRARSASPPCRESGGVHTEGAGSQRDQEPGVWPGAGWQSRDLTTALVHVCSS